VPILPVDLCSFSSFALLAVRIQTTFGGMPLFALKIRRYKHWFSQIWHLPQDVSWHSSIQ
jgi:hypothetical protein